MDANCAKLLQSRLDFDHKKLQTRSLRFESFHVLAEAQLINATLCNARVN